MIWPFLYDVKRTITSKTVLILSAIILLISLAIIPFTSVTSVQGSITQSPVLYYYDTGGYHFLTYIFNQYGDPLSGIHVNVTLSGNANYTAQGVTDSSGVAEVPVNAPIGNYLAKVEQSINGPSYPLTGYLNDAGPGKIQSLVPAGYSPEIASVIDKSNASKRNILVFWSGDYGTAPSSFTLYYKYLNTSFFESNKPYPFNETEMTSLGGMPSDRHYKIFDPSLSSGSNQQGMVWFELFNQTGQAVTWKQFSLYELRPTFQVNTFSIASFFFSTVLAIFVPLMVIIGSYSNYGKDRVTGVLESILARPITRLGLSLSRFLSTTIAFSGAVIACVGIADLLLFRYGGSYLPGDYALAIMGGLVVEVAAFTGLIFLLSHLVRSTGLLLGLSIMIFLILDFFWSLVIFFITILLGGTLGSAVALQATLTSYYANPAQFLNLINVYFIGTTEGVSIIPSSYGVTIPAIVADGILWSTVPFALFLYLAIRRD